MPHYALLCKWTSQGLQNIKQSPSRLDAARKAFESAGGHVKNFYLLTGQYDLLLVVEAPDDISLAKITLAVASGGSVQTETHRAFTEDEYRQIVS